MFTNRRRLSGGCADAAREGAGITSHPRAEILASCAAQHAASSRPMPDAETALLLYDRYFPRDKPGPASDLAGFPCVRQGLRAVITDAAAEEAPELPDRRRDLVRGLVRRPADRQFSGSYSERRSQKSRLSHLANRRSAREQRASRRRNAAGFRRCCAGPARADGEAGDDLTTRSEDRVKSARSLRGRCNPGHRQACRTCSARRQRNCLRTDRATSCRARRRAVPRARASPRP